MFKKKFVTGIEYPIGYVLNVLSEQINPSGAMSIAAGEFDGVASNEDELIIGTGSLMQVKRYNVAPLLPASQNKYIIIKIHFGGEKVLGWSTVSYSFGHSITPKTGISSFIGEFALASGAIYVAGSNTDLWKY